MRRLMLRQLLTLLALMTGLAAAPAEARVAEPVQLAAVTEQIAADPSHYAVLAEAAPASFDAVPQSYYAAAPDVHSGVRIQVDRARE